jgi:hypothetical protein
LPDQHPPQSLYEFGVRGCHRLPPNTGEACS